MLMLVLVMRKRVSRKANELVIARAVRLKGALYVIINTVLVRPEGGRAVISIGQAQSRPVKDSPPQVKVSCVDTDTNTLQSTCH